MDLLQRLPQQDVCACCGHVLPHVALVSAAGWVCATCQLREAPLPFATLEELLISDADRVDVRRMLVVQVPPAIQQQIVDLVNYKRRLAYQQQQQADQLSLRGSRRKQRVSDG